MTRVARDERVAKIVREMEKWMLHEEGGVDALTDTEHCRYLMVENSTITGGFWLQLASSPESAAAAHLGQDYPEDWDCECLIDLDTGETFFPQSQHHVGAQFQYRIRWYRKGKVMTVAELIDQLQQCEPDAHVWVETLLRDDQLGPLVGGAVVNVVDHGLDVVISVDVP